MIDEISIPTTEIEADGFITRPEQLERINAKKARPAEKCVYPNCENCDKYHGHYCTVPMIVNKQNWLLTESLIVSLGNRLTDVEKLVTDEILRSKPRTCNTAEEVNYTWADYFEETK